MRFMSHETPCTHEPFVGQHSSSPEALRVPQTHMLDSRTVQLLSTYVHRALTEPHAQNTPVH